MLCYFSEMTVPKSQTNMPELGRFKNKGVHSFLYVQKALYPGPD